MSEKLRQMVAFKQRLQDKVLVSKYKTMYNNPIISDIILVPSQDFSQRQIRACKCMLAAWSPVFESLFFTKQEAPVVIDYSKSDRSILLPTEFDILEIVIKYMHGFEVDIPSNCLWRVYLFVSGYQITDLIPLVEDLMDRAVLPETCCELLMEGFASGSHDHPALKKAMRVALCEFTAVATTPGFMSLDLSVLQTLLGSDELNAPEEDVCEAVLSWVLLDESRVTKVDSLLKLIRFPLLSPQYVLTLEKHPAVVKSHIVNDMIMMCLRFHMGTLPPSGNGSVLLKQRKGGLMWKQSKSDTCIHVVGDSYMTFTLASSADLIGNYWRIEYQLFPVEKQQSDVVIGMTTFKDHPIDVYLGRHSNGYGIAMCNGNLYNGKCKCDETSRELCTPLCPTFLSFSSPKGYLDLWLNPKTMDLTMKTDNGGTFTRRLIADFDLKQKLYPSVSLVNAKARIIINHES